MQLKRGTIIRGKRNVSWRIITGHEYHDDLNTIFWYWTDNRGYTGRCNLRRFVRKAFNESKA